MKNFNSFTKKANWLKTFNFKQTLNQNNMKKSFSLFVLLSALFGGWSGVVAQIPVHPPTTTNSSCCGLGSLTLTASGADSSEIYKWYDNPTAEHFYYQILPILQDMFLLIQLIYL